MPRLTKTQRTLKTYETFMRTNFKVVDLMREAGYYELASTLLSTTLDVGHVCVIGVADARSCSSCENKFAAGTDNYDYLKSSPLCIGCDGIYHDVQEEHCLEMAQMEVENAG